MLDHQLSKSLSIDEDHSLRQMPHVSLRICARIRGGDKDAFGGFKPDEASHEALHGLPAYPAAWIVPLRLYVDTIKTNPILVDDAINSTIAALAEPLGGVFVSATVAHCDQQIDD